MSLRIAILYCCICGVLNAQDPSGEPPKDTSEVTQPSSGVESHKDTSKATQPKSAASSHTKSTKPVTGAATPVKTAATPPTSSPAQKLLDALDAAIRQVADNGSRTDISDLSAKKSQLQASLNAKGNQADVARQATELLAKLYPPASPVAPPPVPERPHQHSWRQTHYLLVLILVSLMSPLICVAGFWWGAKAAENGLRKGLREAGLL